MGSANQATFSAWTNSGGRRCRLFVVQILRFLESLISFHCCLCVCCCMSVSCRTHKRHATPSLRFLWHEPTPRLSLPCEASWMLSRMGQSAFYIGLQIVFRGTYAALRPL